MYNSDYNIHLYTHTHTFCRCVVAAAWHFAYDALSLGGHSTRDFNTRARVYKLFAHSIMLKTSRHTQDLGSDVDVYHMDDFMCVCVYGELLMSACL